MHVTGWATPLPACQCHGSYHFGSSLTLGAGLWPEGEGNTLATASTGTSRGLTRQCGHPQDLPPITNHTGVLSNGRNHLPQEGGLLVPRAQQMLGGCHQVPQESRWPLRTRAGCSPVPGIRTQRATSPLLLSLRALLTTWD